jgi:hypothetical protein
MSQNILYKMKVDCVYYRPITIFEQQILFLPWVLGLVITLSHPFY